MSNASEMDMNQVCRTCLSSCSEHMKSIYEACSSETENTCFADLLMSSIPLQMSANDGLPTLICYNCIHEINRYQTFQSKCIESDNILRQKRSEKRAEHMIKTELAICPENIKIEHDSSSNENPLTIPELQTDLGQHFDAIKHEVYHISDDNEGENVLKSEEPATTVVSEQSSVLISKKKTDTTAPRKLFTCNYCAMTFKYKSHFVPHVRIHTGEKPFSCIFCSSSFIRKNMLTRHLRSHTGGKPYLCTVCNSLFSDKTALSTHTQIHVVKKPYRCTVCDSAFNRNEKLTIHMRTHTGEKPYSCAVCKYPFSDKSTLTKHMRTHSDTKPYLCTLCDSSFKLKQTLNRHMQIHNEEKPYPCTFCDSSFKQRQNLTRHIRHRHS